MDRRATARKLVNTEAALKRARANVAKLTAKSKELELLLEKPPTLEIEAPTLPAEASRRTLRDAA